MKNAKPFAIDFINKQARSDEIDLFNLMSLDTWWKS
jgi:hypothetical protein